MDILSSIYAPMRGGAVWKRESFESMFYGITTKGKFRGTIRGFPLVRGSWCKKLKYGSKVDIRECVLSSHSESEWENIRLPNEKDTMVQLQPETTSVEQVAKPSSSADYRGANKNTVVTYLGIAADEPQRLARCDGKTKICPLADIGWTEQDCRTWCEENNLLSPIYSSSQRGGCWFCHNQNLGQLRLLRKNYPEYWNLLLKWDTDSPVAFHSDGHTVHDLDKRFAMEERGLVPMDKSFRWKMIEVQKEREKCG